MSRALTGPGDRYRVTVEALTSRGGNGFTRHRAARGVPLPDDGGYRVVLNDALSLVMLPGENGLTIRSLNLLDAGSAVVTARVTAGDGAPEWLPGESTYLLFQGGREEAAGFRERYIPLEGMAEERSWPDTATPLDRLAVAVGRSVARANAALVRSSARAGVALVSGMKIRVAVEQVDVGQGRVLVTLARPGQQTDQFVELTMTTVPGAEETEEGEGPDAPSPDQRPNIVVSRTAQRTIRQAD